MRSKRSVALRCHAGSAPASETPARLTAAKLDDHARRGFQRIRQEGGIEAAFEA
jgi:hypothetical protein